MSDFFTTVQEPRKFRKHLLESSKEVLQILKEHRERADLRERKREKMQELDYHFDELRDLMNELDEYLPEESLRRLEELQPKEDGYDHEDVEEPSPEPEETVEEEPEPEDETKQLERQLDKIQDKLEQL